MHGVSTRSRAAWLWKVVSPMLVLTSIFASVQWVGAVALGLCYVAAVLGVYVTFRVLNFPDLTIEGSFPLGAVLAGTLIAHAGWPHWATLPVALLGGSLAGAATGLLATRLNINGLLASILMMIALQSINLRILGLRSNLPLLDADTVFAPVQALLMAFFGDSVSSGVVARYAAITVLLAIATVLIAALHWFLGTNLGLALRATGDNPQMTSAQGVNTAAMQILGLAISNGMIALAGALFAPYQGFADVSIGRGLIVVGLASVIIGEVLFNPQRLVTALIATAIGSLVYRLFVTLALTYTGRIGLQETDLQLVTALIVIAAMAVPQIRRGVSGQRRLKLGLAFERRKPKDESRA
jgi:putative tryptophan/tyrosine transport system permease protein